MSFTEGSISHLNGIDAPAGGVRPSVRVRAEQEEPWPCFAAGVRKRCDQQQEGAPLFASVIGDLI